MAEPPAAASPPSMEAILASIKRIIDEPGPSPFVAPTIGGTSASPEVEEGEDVLELGTAPTAGFPPPHPPAAIPAPAAVYSAAEEPMLVSPQARAASARAMATLATVTVDPNAAAHTLDGLVREMLRPMLKEWLDANLPELVERVVAREIARLHGK